MDVGEIFSLIAQYGFPIVCCLIMWKDKQDSDARYTENLNQWRLTVDNNTNTMNELKQMVNHLIEKINGN